MAGQFCGICIDKLKEQMSTSTRIYLCPQIIINTMLRFQAQSLSITFKGKCHSSPGTREMSLYCNDIYANALHSLCPPTFTVSYSRYQASFFLAGHVYKSFGCFYTHFSSAKIFHSRMAATINAIRVLA